MKTKYTRRDKKKILNYFYKKEKEYSDMTDELFKSIETFKYVHNGKKLSSTEMLAYDKVKREKLIKNESQSDLVV